jgi:hypothetical protein
MCTGGRTKPKKLSRSYALVQNGQKNVDTEIIDCVYFYIHDYTLFVFRNLHGLCWMENNGRIPDLTAVLHRIWLNELRKKSYVCS